MATKKKSSVKDTEVIVTTSPVKAEGTGKELQPFAMPQLAKGMLQEYQAPETDIPANLDLPDLVKGWEDVKPDFPPVFHFENIGDYLIGTYVELRPSVGPNTSKMYLFEVGQGNQAVKVSIWGKTALDTKMAKIKPGQRVFLQLIGLRKAKYGNDWYDFRVKVAG